MRCQFRPCKLDATYICLDCDNTYYCNKHFQLHRIMFSNHTNTKIVTNKFAKITNFIKTYAQSCL